jgi:hypothetical protein
MSSAFTPTRMRISTDRYEMMIATGVLTKYDRIELIEGDMLDMAPIGTKHSAITSMLSEIFVLGLSRSATIVSGSPVNLGGASTPTASPRRTAIFAKASSLRRTRWCRKPFPISRSPSAICSANRRILRPPPKPRGRRLK